MSFSKPNLQLPLAASYNVRGIIGATNLLTDGLDQRKINSIYYPVKNALTGATTLYLAKRPGVNLVSGTYGDSGQVAYLVSNTPGLTGSTITDFWVFSKSGDDIRVSNSAATTTVIATIAGANFPFCTRMTSISGTETLVLQIVGAAGNRVFYASVIGTWTEITDSDFPVSTLIGTMEFMDGYAFAATNTNRIYNSDINSLSSWQAQNYITKQIQQDIPVGMTRYGKRLLFFGEETVETFVNAGYPTGSPLQTDPSRFARVGLGRNSVSGNNQWDYAATCNDKLYFISINKPRNSVVMAYDGSEFSKVSTPAIERVLSGNNAQTALGVVNVSLRGIRGVALILDNTTSATQRMLIYFPDWNDWFEWTSTVFTPVNNGVAFLGVGSNQHKLYMFQLTTDNYRDSGTDYTMTVQFMLPKDGNHRKRMPMCGVAGDTARSASSLNVEFSDDDYQNFSTARAIDMTSQQKMLARCGSFRTRAVRLTHTGNLDCRLEKFLARIE